MDCVFFYRKRASTQAYALAHTHTRTLAQAYAHKPNTSAHAVHTRPSMPSCIDLLYLLRQGPFQKAFVAFGGKRRRHFRRPFSISSLRAGSDHIKGLEEVNTGHLEKKRKDEERKRGREEGRKKGWEVRESVRNRKK